MLPAREIGGDFYDFFTLADGRIGVLVADVSGKGIPAAFFMAIARTLMKAMAVFTASPASCLAQVNDLLAAENPESLFVTLFYGVIDPATGTLVYSNAGHNPPVLVSGDGQARLLDLTGDVALAVMEGLAYGEASVKLDPGDTLVLYTDGVTEAFDAAGQEFSTRRLTEMLARAVGLSVTEVVQLVMDGVDRFSQGVAQADDITCVAVRMAAPVGCRNPVHTEAGGAGARRDGRAAEPPRPVTAEIGA
jgi:sigma-B regulation protein RsbU (phosphoserine phosphatase)